MTSANWQTRPFGVASLLLDPKNPRLGREITARAPREIIQYLFDHDKALEVAKSIALRGFFPNEPLLAINEGNRLVVVEGNRRLAALKGLREPGLLEGPARAQLEKLARKILDPDSLARVPVTVAPSRKATDRQVAGRHIGTPVLAWQAENRASFILDKITEGYDNDELADDLGFSVSDIQEARQVRAIADMARALPLPEEVKAKLDNPRAKVFTTLNRVFDSSVGREYFFVEKNADHGLLGRTAKSEFVKGFTRLVTDVATGKASSRTLNKNEDIKRYLDSWKGADKVRKRNATFVPSELTDGKTVASTAARTAAATRRRGKKVSSTVLPKNFHVRFGNDRLIDIRDELTKLDRERFPNAGSVLLRVFLELSIFYYLDRIGDLSALTADLRSKGKLAYGTPTMRQILPAVVKIAKAQLPEADAIRVEKALRYDASAPFSISELHAFVHQTGDLPGPREILQFWMRTEPLFRLMLEAGAEETK
ncbi:hypothetical protein [Bradyrhizobium sp. WSM3983]|uniref:hypothetical protein n=1 Tax=Bradyrhizobium sp. WSM3983 TaxID=1038867 RepID=UPI000404C67F|nr:hypothetical protein [Bradyrhizobium sp. WSM3983]